MAYRKQLKPKAKEAWVGNNTEIYTVLSKKRRQAYLFTELFDTVGNINEVAKNEKEQSQEQP